MLKTTQTTHAASRNIEGILFDVDGTLYHQLPLRVAMICLLLFHHCWKPWELIRKLRVIVQFRKSQETLRRLSPFPRTDKSQFALTSERTGESLTFVSDVVEEWFERRPIPFVKWCRRRGIEDVLGRMNRTGMKLGVFSDYPAEAKLAALGISGFMSVVMCSRDSEVDGFKPYSNGFAIAARKMGLHPSRILYVGDRPDVDGFGAVRAGMQAAILGNRSDPNTAHEYPSLKSFADLLRRIEQ